MKRLDVQRLGQVVLAQRTATKLSVNAVAQQAGVSPSTLHRLERGQPPSVEGYLAICEWLRADAGEFVVGAAVGEAPSLINRRAFDRVSGSKARALAALAECAAAIVDGADEDPTA